MPPRSFLLGLKEGTTIKPYQTPKSHLKVGKITRRTQPFPRKQGNFDEVLVESYALEQEMLGLAIRLSLEIGTSDYATPVFVHIHLPPTIAKKEISAKLGFQSALRRLIMFYYHPLWWFESNTHMALHGIKRQLPSNLRISFEKGILQGAIELHLLCVQETERMVLDTRSLDIKSITVDGAPGEYQLGTKGFSAGNIVRFACFAVENLLFVTFFMGLRWAKQFSEVISITLPHSQQPDEAANPKHWEKRWRYHFSRISVCVGSVFVSCACICPRLSKSS